MDGTGIKPQTGLFGNEGLEGIALPDESGEENKGTSMWVCQLRFR
jgi:hypothetical protein